MEIIILGLITAGLFGYLHAIVRLIRDRKVIEYRVMSGKTIRDLGITVNEAIKMGYQPVGGILMQDRFEEGYHHERKYNQPMVKYNL